MSAQAAAALQLTPPGEEMRNSDQTGGLHLLLFNYFDTEQLTANNALRW